MPALELVPALDTTRFRAQLRSLQRELSAGARKRPRTGHPRAGTWGAVPGRLTFDDDLPSHYATVAPMLLDRGVPAKCFACGWAIGSDAGPWWDDLQTVVSQASAPLRLRSSPAVDLRAAIERHPYGLTRLPSGSSNSHHKSATPSPPSSARSHPIAPDTGLRRAPLAGFARVRDRVPHATPLSAHDAERRRARSCDGRGTDELEPLAGRMSSIAYPHGKADGRVAAAAQRAGFHFGFTAEPEAVGADADQLLLGRIEVGMMRPVELTDAIDRALERLPESTTGARVSHRR